jgi:hypothetical protein
MSSVGVIEVENAKISVVSATWIMRFAVNSEANLTLQTELYNVPLRSPMFLQRSAVAVARRSTIRPIVKRTFASSFVRRKLQEQPNHQPLHTR